MLYENIPGCLSQRSRGDTDKMLQGEFAGRALPAWIRCRFFGKEGNKQRPDFLANSKPDPGEAPGVVGTDGLAERQLNRLSARTVATVKRPGLPRWRRVVTQSP